MISQTRRTRAIYGLALAGLTIALLGCSQGHDPEKQAENLSLLLDDYCSKHSSVLATTGTVSPVLDIPCDYIKDIVTLGRQREVYPTTYPDNISEGRYIIKLGHISAYRQTAANIHAKFDAAIPYEKFSHWSFIGAIEFGYAQESRVSCDPLSCSFSWSDPVHKNIRYMLLTGPAFGEDDLPAFEKQFTEFLSTLVLDEKDPEFPKSE